MRGVFLWLARNQWLKTRLPRLWFMRRAVRRFMPGETMEDALRAAQPLQAAGIGTMYTRLGENLTSLDEAEAVADHYVELVDQIVAAGIDGEVSVKPTQLGLDLDTDACHRLLVRLAERTAAAGSYLWLDMEGSAYCEPTIALYERLRAEHPGPICLQAYLRRTAADAALRPLDPAIWPREGRLRRARGDRVARPARGRRKLRRARRRVPDGVEGTTDPLGLGTHDVALIELIAEQVAAAGIAATRSRSRCCTGSAPASSTGSRRPATGSRR